MHRSPSTPPLRAVAWAALLVLLTACGLGSGGSASTSTTHNAADVAFVQGMVPHHRQAVEMAEMAAKQNAGSEVRELAATIKDAQAPEIATMTRWLTAWGEKADAAGSGSMSGMGGSMDGMMSQADMRELSTARGAAFDDLFLTQMIEHHTGAVAMARKERTAGASPQAVDLAASIVKGQTAEIAQMRRLLAAG